MRFPRGLLGLPVTVSLVLLSAACGDTSPQAANDDGCVTRFDPNTDYFPVKQTLRHAKNFSLTYAKNYQVLTVKQPAPGAKPETYVLVRCGTPDPPLTGALAGAVTVRTPVRQFFSASTTHLAFITRLGVLARLKGVASAGPVTSAEVRERVRTGAIAEYTSGQEIDTEKVIAARPDALITAGVEERGYGPLRNAGIKVVADAEWLEPSVLGRAEWIKFFAALTGTERTATAAYDQVEVAYKQLAGRAGARPVTVLPGSMFSGRWTVPAGGGYIAGLIKDAGGAYAWSGTSGTGSVTLDLESVLAKARDAEVWLATESGWRTLADVRKADARYTEFGAYRSGKVWSANKVLGPGGGNDFYERGVARPDLILGDLIAILHPDLMPGYQFAFYQQVPK